MTKERTNGIMKRINVIIFNNPSEVNMIKLIDKGVFYENGNISKSSSVSSSDARKNTIAYQILSSHNVSGSDNALKIKFDAMVSHDITYVGIIQTARIGGLTEFPIPLGALPVR